MKKKINFCLGWLYTLIPALAIRNDKISIIIIKNTAYQIRHILIVMLSSQFKWSSPLVRHSTNLSLSEIYAIFPQISLFLLPSLNINTITIMFGLTPDRTTNVTVEQSHYSIKFQKVFIHSFLLSLLKIVPGILTWAFFFFFRL